MTLGEPAEQVRLSVVRTGRPIAGTATSDLLRDGTAAIGGGTLVAGAFLVEAIKFLAGDEEASWWYLLLVVVGAALVVSGLWQRRTIRRKIRVGIALSALDPRRGPHGRLLAEQAEAFLSTTCRVALTVDATLAGTDNDLPVAQQLAERAITALTLAERLTPDASRVNLVPTIPLHIAFWLGARLSYNYAREVGIHQLRHGDGDPPYFLATTLRDTDEPHQPPVPLSVEAVPVEGVDSPRTALAVDLRATGAPFDGLVLDACRTAEIGQVLFVRSQTRFLPENRAAFVSAVEETARAWRDQLPVDSHAGRHSIFLNCPVSIALALGARLAGTRLGAWTAYTLDPDNNVCEPFPPEAQSAT